MDGMKLERKHKNDKMYMEFYNVENDTKNAQKGEKNELY